MRRPPRLRVLELMARGERAADAGRLAASIRLYERASRLDPDCAQAGLYLAGLRLLAGEETGALAELRRLSGLDHSSLPAYRDLATLAVDQFPGVLPALDRMMARHEGCAWAHVLRAFTLRQLMRYEEAVAELDAAVKLEPGSAALWAIRSRVKLTNAQPIFGGLADVERAVALAPDWGWLHCWRGEALRHAGRQREALRALDKGIALDPRYRLGRAWRGGVLVALGRHADALKELTYFLRWDPIFHSPYDPEHLAHQKAWALNQRMLARRGRGDIRGALKDLNGAHALENRYGWVYNPARQDALYEAGLRELGAVSPWALAWRGRTFQEWGRLIEARAELERAVKLAPALGWPRCWLGRVKALQGDRAGALKTLGEGLASSPRYAPAWGWKGELHEAEGDFAAAERAFGAAIALDYRGAWAYAGRGRSAAAQDRGRQARADFDRALAIFPRYAEALLSRAGLHWKDGRRRQAVEDLKEAAVLKPELAASAPKPLLRHAQRELGRRLKPREIPCTI